MKSMYDKRPVVLGILMGQGLLVFFILFEYFLIATGISECTFKGRIGMTFVTGVLFGALHLLNVLFNHDILHCLSNALNASAFGKGKVINQ